MNITMMRCKADSTDTCNDNAEHFYEILHCERFHKDESGPWYMLSDGMDTGSKCGEKVVNFEIRNFSGSQRLIDFLFKFRVNLNW